MKFLFVLLVGLCSQAFAVSADIQKIDLAKEDTSVEFVANVKPGSMQINGKGAKLGGTIAIAELKLTGELVVHLDELQTGISMRDHHMKEKFLEVQKYPDATLVISEMTLSQNPFSAAVKLTAIPFKGVLKVHGVENKVDGTADIDSTGSQIVAEVRTKTSIPAHQIEKPSYLGVHVAEDIDIVAHMKLKK